MKVAIVQEWLVSVGGSDKVVKAILDVYPNADIYTLVAKKDVCDELGIPWNKVHTSFIQRLPFGKKKYRAFLTILDICTDVPSKWNKERGKRLKTGFSIKKASVFFFLGLL